MSLRDSPGARSKLRSRNTRARRVDSGSYYAGETKGRTIQINRPLPQ